MWQPGKTGTLTQTFSGLDLFSISENRPSSEDGLWNFPVLLGWGLSLN